VIQIRGRASRLGDGTRGRGGFKEETNMRGRYPSGLEYVDRLEGTPEAKRRTKVIMQTLMGELRVLEACQRLGVCEQRFHQLREEMVQAAIARLEARPAGRRRRPAEAAEVTALREYLVDQQQQLHVAQLREEIALAMPQRSAQAVDAEAAAEKKMTRPRVKPR